MAIVDVGEDDAALGAVLRLAKKARHTVGFLPDSAFVDRARQGTLLAADAANVIVGYVLYDLPRDTIRIVQLVIDEHQRGRGHARALLSEVAKRHPSRRGIFLYCRNDFPAHKAWPVLGFSPVGERVGRSIEGRPLTLWWRGFGHPDLFSLLDRTDTRPTAVLDSCVFFDVVAFDPSAIAQQLRSDWLGDHVRLSITDEVLVEISNGKDDFERARQRAAASSLRNLSPPETEWRPKLMELQRLCPGAPSTDKPDLRQMARALAAQASWLVTDDPAFRYRYSGAAKSVGNLRVVSPEEFLREVDEISRGEWYRPVELASTAVTCREVDAAGIRDLAPRFVNHRDGETIRSLRVAVARAAARPHDVHLQLVEVDGDPRGLISFEATETELRSGLVRTVTGRGEPVIARHLVSKLRDEAIMRGLSTVRIVDRLASPAVRRSMPDEGFFETSNGLVAVSLAGRGTLNDLLNRLGDIGLSGNEFAQVAALLAEDGRDVAARSEALFRPYRVTNAGLPTFLAPIRHAWATALFDTTLAAGQLFRRAWELGLRRELVYYRNPRNDGGLSAPSRILWYVSGTRRETGSQTIRGVSMLDEVVLGLTDNLFHRFRRLGIYQERDVAACADRDGRAMALLFSHTELFSSPVRLDEYREIATGDRKSRSVVLQSPQLVSEYVFEEIYRRGSRT